MIAQCRSSYQRGGFAFSHLALLCAAVLICTGASSTHDHGFLSPDRMSIISDGKNPMEDISDGENPMKEPIEDLNQQAKVIFGEEMGVSKGLALLIAIVWIGMIGSAPILIHVLENGKHGAVTKTHIALSVMMWAALFGGLYAFTNVVLFSSPHFTRVRSLNIIECIYFMSQVITTVGYGDIVPAYPRGQVFVAVYAVFAFLVIAELMGEMMKLVTEAVHEYRAENERTMFTSGIKRPSMLPLSKSIAVFLTIAFSWIVFFHCYPGEGKTKLQATYMAIITMSTIGLGAFTPVTEGGMIFGSFLMIFGSASLAKVVMDFSALILELAVWERWDPSWLRKHLKLHKHPGLQAPCTQCRGSPESARNTVELIGEICNNDTHITEAQFIAYSLIENRLATKEQIDGITQAFKEMRPRKGVVSLAKVRQLVDVKDGHVDPAMAPESERYGEASPEATSSPESCK